MRRRGRCTVCGVPTYDPRNTLCRACSRGGNNLNPVTMYILRTLGTESRDNRCECGAVIKSESSYCQDCIADRIGELNQTRVERKASVRVPNYCYWRGWEC